MTSNAPITPTVTSPFWLLVIFLITLSWLTFIWHVNSFPVWEYTVVWNPVEYDAPLMYHVFVKVDGRTVMLGKTTKTEYDIKVRGKYQPSDIGIMACNVDDICSKTGWMSTLPPEPPINFRTK